MESGRAWRWVSLRQTGVRRGGSLVLLDKCPEGDLRLKESFTTRNYAKGSAVVGNMRGVNVLSDALLFLVVC